jgi:hypothetical protein
MTEEEKELLKTSQEEDQEEIPTPIPEPEEPEPMPILAKEPEEEPNYPPANTKVAIANRETEDTELLEHIAGFGMDRGYEVRVYRTSPKKWKGISIEGHLGTFDEWMTEEDLKALYGGGTLQLKIHRPNAKGSMQYLKAVSVKLPGPPRGEGIEEEEEVLPATMFEAPVAEDSILAQQAMSTMKELIDKKQENNAFDPTVMNLMMEPLKQQIASSNAAMLELQRTMADKDARIMELITQKPDTTEKDGLLNKMFDTESSRSEHLRNMHESEMRQLRENAIAEAKRADDRHRDELRSREDIQRREIDNMTRSNQTMMDTLKMSYDSRIESYKKDIERLERDINEQRTELIALRAKKDKTVIEQVSEIQAIKEAFTSISSMGEESDDRKWYEKLASTVVENPESLGQMVGMVTGQPPQQQPMGMEAPHQQLAAPQQQQQMQGQQEQPLGVDDIPTGQPFRAEDGKVYVKVPPDDSIVTYEQALEMANDQEAQQNRAAGKPDPEDVQRAITFMESAFTAGTTSQAFAASAKSLIPQDILKYMETVGIDTFLNEVAILEQGSPLRNAAGRTYMKEVGKFLLEGVPG